MIINIIGPFVVNAPFGTEIAFRKGLEAVGCHVNVWDPNTDQRPCVELDATADATVVFKGCVGRENELDAAVSRDTRILYQPDDMRFPHIRQLAANMRQFCDHFLSFDESSARIAETMGYKNCRKMLVTADPDVYHPDDFVKRRNVSAAAGQKTAIWEERPIDVCFIGSMGDPVAHASRRRMVQIAEGLGKKHGWLVVAKEGIRDPETIRQLYCQSKVVINHATDVGQGFGSGYGLQCRHFEVALTRTCLLSNRMLGVQLDQHPPFSVFTDELSFEAALCALVKNDFYRETIAEDLLAWMQIGHLPIHRGVELMRYIEDINKCI